MQFPCQVGMKNAVKYWKDFLLYLTTLHRNILCWICYQNTHKYKFREITMAHQNLDTFKSVISQVVPIGVLNQLQITKLIVSAPLCFPQIWENWRVVDQSLWHFKLHCISLNYCDYNCRVSENPYFLENLNVFCTNPKRKLVFVLICRTVRTISGSQLV